MKKQYIIFGLIKVLLDFLLVIVSFFIAREIRLVSDFIPGLSLQIQTIDTYNLFIYSIFASFILIFIFSIHSLYSTKILSSKIKEFLNIFLYSFYSFLFFSVIVYLGDGFIFIKEIPRLIIFFSFFLVFFLIVCFRVILNNVWYFLIKNDFLSGDRLIIINNKKKSKIKDIIFDIDNANIYNILGYSNLSRIRLNGFKFFDFDELKKKISNRDIEEIIYIDSDFSKKELYDLWEFTRIYGVRYRYLTNTFDITKTNTQLTLINEIPVLELRNTSLSGWNIILKRFFDIFSSFFLILIFSPIFCIVFIVLKIEHYSCPAFFKNRRVGRYGKEFDLYKFRYMKWEFCNKESYDLPHEEKQKALDYEDYLIRNNSTRKGPLYKIKNDPRKTVFGKFIEKYSIDEIPQLFNVFIGNMSVVGPRPHQPREVKNYKDKHKRLLIIKPGITGMAQVNGREDNNFIDEVNLDMFYIENWSILLDLKILLKTFSSVIKRIKK